MSPQLYRTYRAPPSPTTVVAESGVAVDHEEPAHGRTTRRENPRGRLPWRIPISHRHSQSLASASSDPDDSDFATIRTLTGINPRPPSTAVTAYTPYRAQGISTRATAANISMTARSRLNETLVGSSSESDSDGPPPLEPIGGWRFPPLAPVDRNVTSLEQYLVVVLDGEQFFFRVKIRIQRTLEGGVNPSVDVNFMNGTMTNGVLTNEVWLVFSYDMQLALERELHAAFRRAVSSEELTS